MSEEMTLCSDIQNNDHSVTLEGRTDSLIRTCLTCGHHIKCQDQVLNSKSFVEFCQ